MSEIPIIDSIEEFFCLHDYGLNAEQQRLIKEKLENDASPSVAEIAREVYDDPMVTARDDRYNTVRKFCDRVKRAAPVVELDAEAQKFIRKNAHIMRPIDMARAIFSDSTLAPLSREVKTVEKFGKILGLGFGQEEGSLKDYSPPKHETKLLWKINNADTSANFKEGNLTTLQTRQVANLRSFLSNSRFLSLINGLMDEDERSLFENEFIASAYNKMDMNAEDLQACVSLAYHYVLEKRIQNHLVILDEELMNSVQDEDASLKMTLTEAYGKKSSELDQCVRRIQLLQKALSNNRAERLKAQVEANKSISSIVEIWKEEETRKKMILVAKVTELAAQEVMTELENEESIIASIYGISQEEISDGV